MWFTQQNRYVLYQLVSKLSEFMCEMPKNSNSLEMSCLRPLKDDAGNANPHLRFHGNMSLYRG